MRVYELARDLGVESKEVLAHAVKLEIDVKTASSGLSGEAVELLRLAFAPAEETPEEETPEEKAPAEEAVEEESPEKETAEDPEVAEVESDEDGDEVDDVADLEQEIELASITEGASVAEFADAVGQPASEVVKALLERGMPVGAEQQMPAELVDSIAEGFGYIIEIEAEPETPAVAERPQFDDDVSDLAPRPAVVTVMGHVDHGKTTLLDKIRKANVVEGEQGGITQHIGAYQVAVSGHTVTFIDTPGHEAFTALRARGANITDIVVLVVAADDGVMPQTVEAISHAKAAGVKMIVAVNKMDVPGADPLRVRTELTNHDVVTEDLGGDVPSVELSALSGDGVDELLEVIDLIAQLEDFKGNPKPTASGVVVEAQLERGRGPVASVIVQRGTLKQGDSFVAGPVAGRARALLSDEGDEIKSAGPSAPVQIMGWEEVPACG